MMDSPVPRRSRAHSLWLVLGLLLFVLILFDIPSSAGSRADSVTITGRIEYWDQLAGAYQPLRRAFVEVEGDWWWRSDPETETDADGRFRVTVPNPPSWWGDYDDVGYEVYAETQGLLQVYANLLDFYPYHAYSRTVDNVEDDQTVTIDMRIGGPRGLHAEAAYRGIAETANAFVIHQEGIDFIDDLRAASMHREAFDEKEILVPAAGVTSYYNNVTGYINLVMADVAGVGGWARLPAGNASHVTYGDFKETIRHEYSHAVHDEISGWVMPLGLDSPSEHNLRMETNRFIAFTEGFAAFLPLTTLGIRDHALEYSPLPGSPYPAHREGIAFDPSRNHYAMEGEVAGLLWDVWDPQGMEPLRHPSIRTADGTHPVPPPIVERQFWVDGLSDGRFQRTYRIANHYPAAWPVQTIREFLEAYFDAWPADHHWLKAAAFNRGIVRDVFRERAATLEGEPRLSVVGRRTELSLNIVEPDPEDQPHVRLMLYQRVDPTSVFVEVKGAGEGWRGGRNEGRWTFDLRQVPRAGEELWLEVTDDMLPSVYRLVVPVGPRIDVGPIVRPPLADPDVVARARGIILAPRVLDEIAMEESPESDDAAAARMGLAMPTESRTRARDELRSAIAESKEELRAYGRRIELARRAARGLVKIGWEHGPLSQLPMDPKTFRAGALNAALPAKTTADLSRREESWIDDLAERRARVTVTTPDAESLLRQGTARLAEASQGQLELQVKTVGLRGAMDQGVRASDFRPGEARMAQDVNRVVLQLSDALAKAAADESLLLRLRQVSSGAAAPLGPSCVCIRYPCECPNASGRP